jgi:hypothetical protein
MLQASLQALGMGQKSAAMRGAMLDLRKGDLLGYQKNMFEASTGFDPGKTNMLRMANPFSCLNPAHGMARLFAASKLGKGVPSGRVRSRRSYHTPFGTAQTERRDLRGRGFFGRMRGRSLEGRLRRDPIFRAKFEAKVGGQYVPDGRNDGKVTVRRFKPNILGLAAGAPQALAGNFMAMTALGGLAMMQGQAASMIKGLAGGAQGGSSNNSGIQGKAGSAVSKLGAGATFEDLVAAFMFDVVKDQQDEIKKKMSELQKSIDSKGADAGGGKKGRGGIGGFLKGVLPMAGKALGGVFGGPVGGMIGGAVGSALGGGGKSGGAGGAGGAKGSQDASDSRQMKMEELKNLMQKLQQMQQALSNVLNSMHQGAMNSIRNIRA